MEQTRRAQHRSEQEIFTAMEEFEKAGDISMKEFCEMHQISEATFYNWQKRYRLKDAVKDEPQGFVNVSIADDHSTEEGLFAEVRGIKLYQFVEAAYLKELLS